MLKPELVVEEGDRPQGASPPAPFPLPASESGNPSVELFPGHTESVTKWIVDDTRPVEPTPDADCDTSYLLKLSRGERRARSIVEFSAPSSVASNGWAREALAPFLADDNPPERLIVSLDGTVRVASDA
jgi:hypothetical protein